LDELDAICARQARAGLALLTLTGGEPSCHPEFIEAVELAKSHGLCLIIMTNGTGLDREKVRRLSGLLDPDMDRVELSLDAVKPETYRLIRGRDNLDAALNAMAWFSEFGIAYLTITVLLKPNLDQVDGVLDLAVQYKALTSEVAPPLSQAFHTAGAASPRCRTSLRPTGWCCPAGSRARRSWSIFCIRPCSGA
jgi:pyrroloquinoline quinone biosynthesis protein E